MDKDKMTLQTAPEVDLARYSGKWYEIARLPNRFEDDCVADVTATYTLREDGGIRVVNECRQADGRIKRAEGNARLADKDGPTSKLQVSFVTPFLHFVPFVWADYWVLELDPDYRFAAVGEPNRDYLWILSRSPELDEAVVAGILERLATQGYDVSQLVRTRHSV